MAHRFARTVRDRVIAGVCGGLARYFDVDVRLVRVAMAVLGLTAGSGLLLYLGLWAFTPASDSVGMPASPRDEAGVPA